MEYPSANVTKIIATLKKVLENAGGVVKKSKSGSIFIEINKQETEPDIQWRDYINEKDVARYAGNNNGKNIRLLATRRISHAVFERCRENSHSAIDINGNGVLNLNGLRYERYITPIEEKPLSVSGTPFSMKSSRLARAFLTEPSRSWTQTELIKATGLTQGHASRSLKLLICDGYIEARGSILKLLNPDRLLNDWAAHYRFDRHKRMKYALNYSSYEDGLRRLHDVFSKAGVKYAFTGWSGAYLSKPYAVPLNIMVYALNVPENPGDLGLHSVEHGENCTLIEPNDEGVIQFLMNREGLNYVSPSQLYLDLRRMPGRAREQAEVIREKYLNWKKDE